MIKNCLICDKEINVPDYLKERKKYCSKVCFGVGVSKRMRGNTYWEKTTKTQFKKGHKYLGVSGEKHQSWKYGGRNSTNWKNWSNAVKKRDKWTCKNCGYIGHKASSNICAHHLIHYKLEPKLRFVVANGLTVCRKCHPLYHPEVLKQLNNH